MRYGYYLVLGRDKLTKLTIKKRSQGKYKLYRNRELVATAIFTPRYYPMPHIREFELSVSVDGKITMKKLVKSIVEGKKVLREYK